MQMRIVLKIIEFESNSEIHPYLWHSLNMHPKLALILSKIKLYLFSMSPSNSTTSLWGQKIQFA